ncbi:MAG TPA: DUF4190 domain-containing protein [Mycobacteriales bacterium]|nr:DUF4190 domain-containing protein [Mycobacteriales bacterium]
MTPEPGPQPPYAAPPGWQRPPVYAAATSGPVGYGYPPYGYPARPSMNGFAIGAASCAVALSILPFLGGVLGLVFGIIAVRQIRHNGDRGRGLALAGITLGSVELVVCGWS